MKTDAELKQLALDMYAGKVFTDRHFRNPEEANRLLPMVFLPLAFMTEVQIRKLDGAGMFYEYLDQAAPNGINGYPIFFSCKVLKASELVRLERLYARIHEALAEVT